MVFCVFFSASCSNCLFYLLPKMRQGPKENGGQGLTSATTRSADANEVVTLLRKLDVVVPRRRLRVHNVS